MTRAEVAASRATHRVIAEAREKLRSAEGPSRAILVAAIDVIDRSEQLAGDLNRRPYLNCKTADGFDRGFIAVDSPADRAELFESQPVAYALTLLRIAHAIGNALADELLAGVGDLGP